MKKTKTEASFPKGNGGTPEEPPTHQQSTPNATLTRDEPAPSATLPQAFGTVPSATLTQDSEWSPTKQEYALLYWLEATEAELEAHGVRPDIILSTAVGVMVRTAVWAFADATEAEQCAAFMHDVVDAGLANWQDYNFGCRPPSAAVRHCGG